ncbi:MAG: YdeI/OmpD-associated family protein [Chloroflexota bacterium]
MKFRTEIEQGSSKNVTGIEVPEKIVEALGAGKRPPVKVTINGYTYRNTIAVMGGAYMLSVSAEVREHAGVKGGDKVDVDIELDTEPREVTVPPDLAKALARDTKAKKFFDGLSYSNKRRIVGNVEGAKTAETRTRRIEKSVEMLREGRT